ncbi:PilZ domain-containing protein [Paenibacillus sp. TRM 82003]|nr:PilZ domain-containing protein [Paenibacillus sp. TRM 82003]
MQCYESWIGAAISGDEASPSPEQAEPEQQADVSSGSERRRAPRIKVDIPLQISIYQWEQEGSFHGQQIEATLRDLSESGLQVLSKFPLAMDMFVVIHFPKEADLPPITGKIIRVVPDGAGFRYGCMLSGLPPFVRLKLEDYLHEQAERQQAGE